MHMIELITTELTNVTLATFFILVSISIVAGFLRGLAGFGSAMLMAGPIAMLIGPKYAVAIIVLLEALISVPLMKSSRLDVNWPIVKHLFLAAMFTAPLGLLTLQVLPVNLAGQIIAVVVIISAIALLIDFDWKPTATIKKDLFSGGISGFTCGVAGIAGPPVVLYLLSASHSHRIVVIRATLIYYFACIDFYVLIALLMTNELGITPFVITAICFPIMYLSAIFGVKKIAEVNSKQYKKLALLTIISGNVISLLMALST